MMSGVPSTAVNGDPLLDNEIDKNHGTYRFSEPFNFERYMTERSAFFGIENENLLFDDLLNLEEDVDEKLMKKKMLEGQLESKEESQSRNAETGSGGHPIVEHLESFDVLALSMEEFVVKMDGLPALPGGFKKRAIKQGSGNNAKKGDMVWIHYKLFVECSDEAIDDTFAQGSPKRFTVGKGEVIAALDLNVLEMNKGQTDHVLVSHHYAFGPLGCAPRIPKEARVLLHITLVNIKAADAEVPIEDLSPDQRRDFGFDAILEMTEKRKAKGNDFLKQDNYHSAVQEYMRAQELVGELAALTESENFQKHNMMYALHVNLAMCYLAMKKFPKAIFQCNEALTIPLQNSNKVKAYYRLAKAQFELGKLEDAEENAKRAHGLNCNDLNIKRLQEQITKAKAKRCNQEKEMAQKMFGNLNMK